MQNSEHDIKLRNRWEIAGSGAHLIRSHRAQHQIFRYWRTAKHRVRSIWGKKTAFIAVSAMFLAGSTSVSSVGYQQSQQNDVESFASMESLPQIFHRNIPPAADRSKRTLPKVKATPAWVKPLRSIRVTSCFGLRWGRQHQGVDLGATAGTPILSVGNGIVLESGWTHSGYGISVLVDHGTHKSFYAHASKTLVQPGQRIRTGEKIALIGSTGHSTGPHLHFGVLKGNWSSSNWINPVQWLSDRNVYLNGGKHCF